ncbi:MAG: porin, partial [Mesorhizobium sp.]
GVQAADAVVVAEPEPAEYVRVCDVYGAGYFYIPGTETCLRVGGLIRQDIFGGSLVASDRQDLTDIKNGNDRDSYHYLTRAELRFWTGQETELGTLSTYVSTRFDWANGGKTDTSWLKYGWVQLGGLRLGKDESAFDAFSGYAGNVIQDSLIGYGGDFDTNLISYTFDAGNGFSAIISLEQGYDASETDAAGVVLDPWNDHTIRSYVPHIVGGIKYTQGWGTASLVAGYDSNYRTVAVKGRLGVNVGPNAELWAMGAYSNHKFGRYGYGTDHDFYKNWDGKWAVYGGGTYKVNEKTSLNAQLSYDASKTFAATGNVSYDIVPGWNVTAEVSYANYKNWKNGFQLDGETGHDKGDAWGVGVRFDRSF